MLFLLQLLLHAFSLTNSLTCFYLLHSLTRFFSYNFSYTLFLLQLLLQLFVALTALTAFLLQVFRGAGS